MKKKMTYVPKVFAHKVTQDDLDSRPELTAQGIAINSIELFREIGDEDIAELKLPLEMKGEWALNSAFDVEVLADDVDAKMEIIVKTDGINVELDIVSNGDEMTKPFILLGAIDIAKQELMDSFTQKEVNPVQSGSVPDMVDYTFTQLDIDTMGDMNPGHKVGDTIKMPLRAVEMLQQTNEVEATLACGEDCVCDD